MGMSQDLVMQSSVSEDGGPRTTQNARQNNWAADDVHRIAMRRPALYKTNSVPQVSRPTIFDNFERGVME